MLFILPNQFIPTIICLFFILKIQMQKYPTYSTDDAKPLSGMTKITIKTDFPQPVIYRV